MLADRKRQEYIEQFGITFLRFTNAEIENDIRQVISLIKQKIDYLKGLSKG